MRVVAALSAVAALPLVLVLGNDLGTRAGERVGLVILLGGSALIAWVILCCVIPGIISGWLRRSIILRMLLVDLPAYVFAFGGLSWFATRVHIWLTR